MSFSASDLTPLLTPPPSQSIRFGQAKILSWDQETFENTVSWRGITLTNLPVLAGAEALSFQAGDTVGLLGWGTTAAAGSWWILGRVVLPGSAKGEQAIDWMTSSLGRALAADVFADRFRSDVWTGFTTVDQGSSYVAAPDGNGPAVTAVPAQQWLIVMVTADIQPPDPIVDGDLGSNTGRGFMSFDVDGPSSYSATDDRALAAGQRVFLNTTDGAGDELSVRAEGQASRVQALPVLPGTYDVTAMYRAEETAGSGPSAIVASRVLVVIGV